MASSGGEGLIIFLLLVTPLSYERDRVEYYWDIKTLMVKITLIFNDKETLKKYVTRSYKFTINN